MHPPRHYKGITKCCPCLRAEGRPCASTGPACRRLPTAPVALLPLVLTRPLPLRRACCPCAAAGGPAWTCRRRSRRAAAAAPPPRRRPPHEQPAGQPASQQASQQASQRAGWPGPGMAWVEGSRRRRSRRTWRREAPLPPPAASPTCARAGHSPAAALRPSFRTHRPIRPRVAPLRLPPVRPAALCDEAPASGQPAALLPLSPCPVRQPARSVRAPAATHSFYAPSFFFSRAY